MKFATWNIGCGARGYHGQAVDGMAAWLTANAIDICVMQEVDRFALRSGFRDYPAYLQDKTGLHAYYIPSFMLPPEAADQPQREYGNAILSRYPLSHFQMVPLHPVSIPADALRWEKEPRSALIAKVEGLEQELWVVTSHLAYSPDLKPSSVRRQQVELLVNAINTIIPSAAAVIFGGDLNTAANGFDIDDLRTALTIQTSAIGPTWPLGGTMAEGRAPYIAIDHIFTRNLTLGSITRHDESRLSDHSIVTATLKL